MILWQFLSRPRWVPTKPEGVRYVLYRYRKSLLIHHGAFLLLGTLGVFSDYITRFVPEIAHAVTIGLLSIVWFTSGGRLLFLLNGDNLLPGTYFKVVVVPFLGMSALMMLTAIFVV